MTYVARPLLFLEHDTHGYTSSLEQVYTNGSIVRSYRGHRMTWLGNSEKGLEYAFFNHEGVYQGVIADEIISERVLVYMRDYYGHRRTNCSSFTHFVTTGQFVECEHEQNQAVVAHGMRPFSMVSRVEVGDVVWIAYAQTRYFRSRQGDVSARKKFMRAQKEYHETGLFSAVVKTAAKSREPEMILDLCKNPCLNDYHFMVCVAHEQGKPVWLFQNGYHNPGESHNSFGMTVGLVNPYPKAPLFAYIKKRRRERTA